MTTIVIKIGGSTLGAEDTTLQDVVALQGQGWQPVVVHGGGPMISEWSQRLGITPRFEKGLRVTDEQTLQVVVALLAGWINKELVARLTALGGKALGLSGIDGGLLVARVKDPVLGYVGEVVQVKPQPVLLALEAGYVPVVAPMALSQGDTAILNVNGDTAAGELAIALKAQQLIFLTDVDWVRDGSGTVMPRLSASKARRLLAQGVIVGGMIPKVEAALRAASNGVSCWVVDGRRPHALAQAASGRPRTEEYDLLPEHALYRDEGCDLFPSCLRCPLPACRWDMPFSARPKAREGRSLEAHDPARAVEISPEDAVAWRDRGLALMDLGRYVEAAQALARAVESRSNDAVAWRDLGLAWLHLGKYAEAERVLARAVELDAEDAVAWRAMGLAQLDQARYVEAEQALSRAVALQPRDAPSWYGLGLVWRHLGKLSEAEAALARVVGVPSGTVIEGD
ncbi:MAG: acetylglutamate kinase [Chloroflexi bacterium]|nr:acetylglutamate kinase [Chloroflexota bacterium]